MEYDAQKTDEKNSSNLNPIPVIFILGFFILIGVIFLTIGIVVSVNNYNAVSAATAEYSKNHTTVTAVVEDVETVEKGERDEYGGYSYTTMNIRVSYEVNGAHYESELKNTYIGGTEKGDKIDIDYQNDDPRQIVLSSDLIDQADNSFIFNLFLWFGVGIFFVLFGSILLFVILLVSIPIILFMKRERNRQRDVASNSRRQLD